MNYFVFLFAVIAALFTQTTHADALAGSLDSNGLDIMNAMIHCQTQVTAATTSPFAKIVSANVTSIEDQDVYEVVIANVVPSPLSHPYDSGVLKISRSFQPAHCPPGAADCGGGQMVYSCDLRVHTDNTAACSNDIGTTGWPNHCSCPNEKTYDLRLGSCF